MKNPDEPIEPADAPAPRYQDMCGDDCGHEHATNPTKPRKGMFTKLVHPAEDAAAAPVADAKPAPATPAQEPAKPKPDTQANAAPPVVKRRAKASVLRPPLVPTAAPAPYRTKPSPHIHGPSCSHGSSTTVRLRSGGTKPAVATPPKRKITGRVVAVIGVTVLAALLVRAFAKRDEEEPFETVETDAKIIGHAAQNQEPPLPQTWSTRITRAPAQPQTPAV